MASCHASLQQSGPTAELSGHHSSDLPLTQLLHWSRHSNSITYRWVFQLFFTLWLKYLICTCYLSVTTPSTSSDDSGKVAGAVTGVLVITLFIVVGVAVITFYKKRRRRKKMEHVQLDIMAMWVHLVQNEWLHLVRLNYKITSIQYRGMCRCSGHNEKICLGVCTFTL